MTRKILFAALVFGGIVCETIAADRFSFWEYPGMTDAKGYFALRIDPDENTLYLVSAEPVAINRSVCFVYHQSIDFGIRLSGRTINVYDGYVDIDSSPSILVHAGTTGAEVLLFDKTRILSAIEKALKTASSEELEKYKKTSELEITLTITLKALVDSKKTLVEKPVISEPVRVKIAGKDLKVIAYCADGFFGEHYGFIPLNSRAKK